MHQFLLGLPEKSALLHSALLQETVRFRYDNPRQPQQADQVGDSHQAVHHVGEVPDQIELDGRTDGNTDGIDEAVWQ